MGDPIGLCPRYGLRRRDWRISRGFQSRSVKHFPGETPKNLPTAWISNGEIRTKLPKRLTRGFRNTFNPRDIIPVVKRSELSSEFILKWSGR
ncbi:MAG: hypothetical protein RL077_3532 [Verrucomicrobiota bacterium]